MIAIDELARHCSKIFQIVGLSKNDSGLVADSLVDAEARGITSHGVSRTRIYAERLRAGLLVLAARPELIRETAGGLLIDARNAIGQVGALAGDRDAGCVGPWIRDLS